MKTSVDDVLRFGPQIKLRNQQRFNMDYKDLGTQPEKRVFQNKNKIVYKSQAEGIIKNLKKQ